MIAWKKSLPEYEWLIHQVWYLEVPEGEVIDPKSHLIPNPRAHLLFTPPEQGYSYDTGDTKLAGKGVATRACQMMTEIGLTELNAHKVSADCYASNAGSYKTLEKNGFTQEGRQKDYYKREQGFDDKLYYGMTAEQFASLNR